MQPTKPPHIWIVLEGRAALQKSNEKFLMFLEGCMGSDTEVCTLGSLTLHGVISGAKKTGWTTKEKL